MNGVPVLPIERLAVAAGEYREAIAKESRAFTVAYRARKVREAAARLYQEELGEAINAKLSETGLAFCRWKSHLVEGSTRIVFVTGSTEHNCHEWSTSRRPYWEVLPICNECLDEPGHVHPAEKREDGWHYLENGLWQSVGDTRFGVRIMLYPEGKQLEDLALQFGFEPLAHFLKLIRDD